MNDFRRGREDDYTLREMPDFEQRDRRASIAS
jgi:hypothetical protein